MDPAVLHLVAPGEVGGGESVLLGLTIGLHRRGLRVGVAPVLSSSPERHPLVRALRAADVPVQPILVPRRGYVRERREIRRLLEQRRPDVVHTHGYRADLLHAGIARRLGIPTVTTIHGSSRMSWRTAIYEAIQFRLLRRFQAVVAVSRPLVADVERAGVPAERIRLVPNSWDGRADLLSRSEARKRLRLPPDAFVIGFVGRLIPVKGCDIFLRALSRVADAGDGVLGSIIGDGPERQSLEALSADLGLAGRVRFHGSQQDAATLFRAFDVWVLSSRSEGTPMALFEAMAAGVPIVAAKVGGVADALSDREGFLVAPQDPDGLARCIEDILAGRGAPRERTAAASARLVEQFGPDQWIDRHLAVYREVVRSRER
jgi:glycosyltransferase involved in cell wall biosynthesis